MLGIIYKDDEIGLTEDEIKNTKHLIADNVNKKNENKI